MKIQLTIKSGARAGQSQTFDQPFVQIGRHPHCDLRFDPDRDLDVSSRHASITATGELYVLRDLGSTNGTFVHGKRLTADHVLAHGDVVQFGSQGPKAEIWIHREDRPGPAPPRPARRPRPPVPGRPRPTADRSPRRTPAAARGHHRPGQGGGGPADRPPAPDHA